MIAVSPRGLPPAIAAAVGEQRRVSVIGVEGSLTAIAVVAAMAAVPERMVAVVAVDGARARIIAQDVALLRGLPEAVTREDGSLLVVPDVDTSPYADVSPDPRAVGTRLGALARLGGLGQRPQLVAFGVRSWSRRTLSPAVLGQRSLRIATGTELGREDAIAALVAAGYARVEVVEDPGTFAVRGGVLDAWVPSLHHPFRLEWFGDEVERLRRFDAQTQRSQRELSEVHVHPVRETIRTTTGSLRARALAVADAVNAPSSSARQTIDNLEQGLDFFGIDGLVPIFHDELVPLSQHLPADAIVVVESPDSLLAAALRHEEEHLEQYEAARAEHRLVAAPEAFFLPVEALRDLCEQAAIQLRVGESLDEGPEDRRALIRLRSDREARLRADLEAARRTKGSEVLRPLVEVLHARMRPDVAGGPWRIVVTAHRRTHAERLVSLLESFHLPVGPPRRADTEPALIDALATPPAQSSIEVVIGELSTGWSSTDDGVLVLSESDVFGPVARKAQGRRGRSRGLGDLTQLRVGDYIVHMLHGVGRYEGLTQLSLAGVPGDFVVVQYQGTDKLYLPVHRLGEIERYTSAEAKPPKLDRLGGQSFATKTGRVKAEVAQLAEELLQIYAQRQAREGHAFPPPDELCASFEASFPFEETPDQDDAITAVYRDLAKPQPMDRVVCGDVGFGKTEVALRAAFRVASAGKQVAVLAPTTVLVQQHFHTFRDRMAPFGVRVEHLSRFTGPTEKKRVVNAMREGTVDLVVGTHRLLSTDVRFKDLGLVVVDEEQRFGVAHKERFKKLKTQVDVLTLSATPIPRTLHMSLLGLREISLVMTPPSDRLAIRTILTRPGDRAIAEGIRKELARGGQVFYVVPKILGIEEHAVRIRRLVPEARVIVAHGQMPGDMLERTMVDFVEHRADVLVSTTIIESGLDIPRANTMFVDRADVFGLSQLYQLRGRIGRSRQRAYCHLMVASLEKLSPEARRRLEAIQRHAELGSGFAVAAEDLEIRGAGELLGGRQSGQIQAVGFDTYARILQEAVAELRGDEIVRESDPELTLDVPAYLPAHYVEDIGQRLELYRRLSTAADVDAVADVMAEIRDRFGPEPGEAEALAIVMAAKTWGRRLRALAIELRGEKLAVRLSPDTPLPASTAAALAKAGRVTLSGSDRLVIALPRGPALSRLRAAEAALAEIAAAVR